MPAKLAFSLILAAMIVGCDRDGAAPEPKARPAPNTPPAVASTTPATTRAVMSLIWVDQQVHQFPGARIAISHRNDQLTAQLFSDDPPSAINDNYTGNSFYLDMSNFDLQEPASLDGAAWTYKAPNSERAESVSGIFLLGRRWHLQPFDVHAAFQGTTSPMKIELAGQFLMFDNDEPRLPGKLVQVRAEIEAEVSVKGGGK